MAILLNSETKEPVFLVEGNREVYDFHTNKLLFTASNNSICDVSGKRVFYFKDGNKIFDENDVYVYQMRGIVIWDVSKNKPIFEFKIDNPRNR